MTADSDSRRIVLYVNSVPGGAVGEVADQCKKLAAERGWVVADCITAFDGVSEPEQRESLAKAIEALQQRRATTLLVPWQSMVSPLASERDAVAARAQQVGADLIYANALQPA